MLELVLKYQQNVSDYVDKSDETGRRDYVWQSHTEVFCMTPNVFFP